MIQILIVDDDSDIRDVVSHEVQEQGWVAIKVDSEAEMSTALREQTPDIILLDIRLPDQDGLTIARRVVDGLKAGLFAAAQPWRPEVTTSSRGRYPVNVSTR